MNFEELMDAVSNRPVSDSLSTVLRLAIDANQPQLLKWVKLELNGYFNTNPELTEEVIVPEYRTVAGHHSDDFGRPLVINNADLSFVNTTRIRFGVADLEKFSEKSAPFSYRDPHMSKIVKDNMGVDVTTYTFETDQLVGVVSGIKVELIEKLIPLKRTIESLCEKESSASSEDVIEIKPNFYGIGFNLNALRRRWKSYISNKK